MRERAADVGDPGLRARGWCVAALCLLVLARVAGAGGEHDSAVAALGGPGAEAREEARERLRRGGAEALPALLAGLGGEDPVTAAACAVLLGEGAFGGVREAILPVLDRPGTPRLVLRACVRALGRVGDGRDVPRLLALAGDLGEAGEALAAIGDRTAVEGLRAVVSRPGTPPEAAWALAVLGVPGEGVPALIGALEGPRGVDALRCLRRFAGKDAGNARGDWEDWWRVEEVARGLGSADFDESEAALARALDDAGRGLDLLRIARDTSFPRDARTKALLALGLRREAPAAPAVTGILCGDGDGMVRLYAAEALGRIGCAEPAVDLARYLIFDEEPFRKLTAKGLTEPYYTIDCEVAKALVRLGVKGGLDALVRFLGEEHRVRVHHEALRVLVSVTGRPAAYEPDAAREQRREAAERWRRWFDENREALALPEGADFTDPSFQRRVERLVDTLGHFHFLSMSRARETLVVLGEVAVPALRAGLRRRELHVRIHCAEILGRIRAKSCRPDLAVAMGDAHPEVRSAAAAALAVMGPGEGTAAVLRGLSDTSADVRLECLRALARVPAETARREVARTLARRDSAGPDFRRDGLFALAAHGDGKAMEELLGLLGHPDAAFRQTVAERVRLLSGRDPGTTPEGLAAWRAFMERTGASHVPCYPYGSDR